MNDEPTRATGGPTDPGKSYLIGEDGPEPLILPRGWEHRTFPDPGPAMVHVSDGKGGWTQVWPPLKPQKPAWWESGWPPFVLALLALIAGITSIVMSLGG